MNRDLFAREALLQIPKILTLMDRNQHSPTYGCFDRNAWHYRIIDFPSGMAQEFVWPLALAYSTNYPGNPFYKKDTIVDWVQAGIAFSAQNAHRDGSCDDYFPFERAAGATAFSLLACLESCDLLKLDLAPYEKFFRKRAEWLASCEESGRLTNHQALIVLCLDRVGQLMKTNRWDEAKQRRLNRILDWQHEEGWFPEYEGFDPGYTTLTIWCLARLLECRPDMDNVRVAITRSVELIRWFIHPDGSFGGEYTSRNTYNFFPHGFELVGRWLPEALGINDQFLSGLSRGKGSSYADDHIIGHHTWNYLLAWRDFVEPRPKTIHRPRGRLWLKDAGIMVDCKGDTDLYIALNKGGVFKCFSKGQLVASDTQVSLLLKQGRRIRNAVGHLIGNYQVEVTDNSIRVYGHLGWAKQTQMTTTKLILMRLIMLSAGRFFPDLIRRLLQRILIIGKSDAPVEFTRELTWRDGTWHVRDEVRCMDWRKVLAADIGCDQTSIYVAMSRTFQDGQLHSWLDLMPWVFELNQGQPLIVERSIENGTLDL